MRPEGGIDSAAGPDGAPTVIDRPTGWGRNVLLLCFVAAFLVLFAGPLRELFEYALHPKNRRYNGHIVFIPLVSGYLLFLTRKAIADRAAYPGLSGVPLILGGVVLSLVGSRYGSGLPQADHLALTTFASVLTLTGGALFFFGKQSVRAALFPLLFLLFLVPAPTRLMDGVLAFLQVCSTEISYVLFRITGIPIAREGFLFHLPGLSIEIAKECAGARATISLLIIGVLAGHLFLRTTWKKAILGLSTVPISLLGNSVRIAGLTLLAIYVDRDFIRSASLPHMRGGWAFFLVDLLVVGGVLAMLMRSETRSSRPPAADQAEKER